MTTPDTRHSEGGPATHSQWFHRHETIIPFTMVLFAVAFTLYKLYPNVAANILDGNDMVLHLSLTNAAVEAITQRQNFTDPWQGTMGMGFPLFHYYQHLPHIALALVHVLTFRVFALSDLLHWTNYLLLSLFPLSIYWSLRRFGFDRISSAMGGLVSPLTATDALY